MTPWEALAGAITRLNDRIDALPSFREATVSSLSPLSVQFDTDTDSTIVQGSLAPGVAMGYRVMTLKLRHYVWIIGTKWGRKAAYLANGLGTTSTASGAGWYKLPPLDTPLQIRNDGFTLMTDGRSILPPYPGLWRVTFLANIKPNGTPITLGVRAYAHSGTAPIGDPGFRELYQRPTNWYNDNTRFNYSSVVETTADFPRIRADFFTDGSSSTGWLLHMAIEPFG